MRTAKTHKHSNARGEHRTFHALSCARNVRVERLKKPWIMHYPSFHKLSSEVLFHFTFIFLPLCISARFDSKSVLVLKSTIKLFSSNKSLYSRIIISTLYSNITASIRILIRLLIIFWWTVFILYRNAPCPCLSGYFPIDRCNVSCQYSGCCVLKKNLLFIHLPKSHLP